MTNVDIQKLSHMLSFQLYYTRQIRSKILSIASRSVLDALCDMRYKYIWGYPLKKYGSVRCIMYKYSVSQLEYEFMLVL